MKIVNITDESISNEKYLQYMRYLALKMNINKMFTLVFVDNEYIQKMNLEFRQKDIPTDVLTFPDESTSYLGDVIISLDKVKEQAKEYGHSFEREIHFLITHGFLHLLGYDHINKEKEKEMFNLQEKLLDGYNIKR